MSITRTPFAILTATLALAAGCGGDDRLSEKELSAELNPAVERVSSEFGAVFAALGQADEEARVPADVRARLRAAAGAERDVSSQIAKLEPPETAEAAVDKLAAASREQAAELERLAGRSDLTVREMADALERGATTEAIAALAERGLVTPPRRG